MRVVTRGDLDGAVCTAIIMSHERVDEVLLLHPQDMHRVCRLGGGGRKGAGTAPLPLESVDEKVQWIIDSLQESG